MTDVLFVEIRGRRCALPVPAVREVFALGNVTPVPGAPAVVRGVTPLHGRVVPLLDLGAWVFPGTEALAQRTGEEAVAVECALPGEEAPVQAALAVDRVLQLGAFGEEAIRQPAGTISRPGRSRPLPAVVATILVDASGPASLLDVAAILGDVREAGEAAARDAP